MSAMRLPQIDAFKVTGFLGAGIEGAVYRCRAAGGQRYVVKRFYDHRVRQIHEGIAWHRKPVAPMSADLGV